ncbi:MAG TPA: hypothetical protein VFQ80_08770 [Thermomicrobiales bacterium]|nr:hypothetical protein [Thermomicrobiales bacterium]
MPADPTAATDAVRFVDAARLPDPPRFTPEEESIDFPDEDDDPVDPLTPADLWF